MENYQELIEKYGLKIPYSLLLKTKEWFEKRDYILRRDKHHCQKCNIKGSFLPGTAIYDGRVFEVFIKDYRGVILQVHHKYYIIRNRIMSPPWDYKDDCLITVCTECHKKIHDNEKVPYLIDGHKEIDLTSYTKCSRCDGFGRLPVYHYHLNGICFRCHGLRYDEFVKQYGDERNL